MVLTLFFALAAVIFIACQKAQERHRKHRIDQPRPKRKGTPPGLGETLFLCLWICGWTLAILLALGVLITTFGRTLFTTLFLSAWLIGAAMGWAHTANRIAKGGLFHSRHR